MFTLLFDNYISSAPFHYKSTYSFKITRGPFFPSFIPLVADFVTA